MTDARRVLDAAYAAGIRYVDVARSYGRAEEFLAGWLAAHPEVDDVVVGSKWGYRYVGDWRIDAEVHEVKDHSLAAFTAAARRRPAHCSATGSAVYHVHSATLDTGVLEDAALHRALAGLRERGVRVGRVDVRPEPGGRVRRALASPSTASRCSPRSSRPGTSSSPPPGRRWPRRGRAAPG